MDKRDLERGPQGDHGQSGDAGPVGPQGPQGPAAPKPVWWKGPTARLVAFIVVAVAAIYSTGVTFKLAEDANRTAETANAAAAQAQAALRASDRQRVEARNQICAGDEREHVRSVERVVRTYEYLTDVIEPDEHNSSLTRAIVRQLPELEREARDDTAPEFCDEPGMGLKEPDLELPERPALVTRLIQDERRHLGD